MAKKAKRMKRSIKVPELNQEFTTLSSAARALGIDAANLSKVISGSRKSVGGYQITSKSKKRGVQQIVLSADPRREQITKLQKLLEASNKEYTKIRRDKVSYFAKYNQKAFEFLDDIGANSKGLYNTDYKNLSRLSDAEIKKFTDALTAIQKHETFTAVGANKAAETRLYNLSGLTLDQGRKYSTVLPMLFDMLDSSEFYYEEIIEAFTNAVEHKATSDQVISLLAGFTEEITAFDFLMNYAESAGMHYRNKTKLINFVDLYGSDPNDPTLKAAANLLLKAVQNGVDKNLIGRFAAYLSDYNNDITQTNIDIFDEAVKDAEQKQEYIDMTSYINDLLRGV